jgi:glycerol-3-phosphate acyltransferase PlsY
MTMLPAVFVVVAYLIGSLSFAVIVSRVFGLPDPHSYGSRNPGATNVLRSGKKAAALLTLVGDSGKGWLAVMLALWLAPQYGIGTETIAAVALAVFLGHLFPLFFGFKGGKGVATALGILLAINPWLGLATLATWLIIAFFFRISSLAAIVAAAFAPFCAFWWFGTSPFTYAVLAISLLLVWRHEANIRKLLAGQESRIGQKRAGGS